MKFRTANVQGQRQALKQISDLIAKYSYHPDVVRAARAITNDLDSRDDEAEVRAIFDAVKHGTPKVPWLRNGFRYVADPRYADFYASAPAIIRECKSGACGGDCDEHTALVGTLCAAIGFKVGARAWGPKNSQSYEHVYPVIALPKKGPWPRGYAGHGADTTVQESSVGWEPPTGRVLTYWIMD